MFGRRARRTCRVGLALVLALSLGAVPPASAQAATPTPQPPPPTPVPVPGGGTSPSPFPTRLVTPSPSTQPPKLSARAAMLADLDTGQVLYQQDADARRPIASLTKIMTALLAIRRTDPREVVTVSPDAAAPHRTVGMSELGLLPGERITVENLLYALLLQSANDAADVLAEHVSGSVEAFVEAMNAEAARLGMRDTRFASPSGLDDDGYSTARDLVTLTRAAFDSPLFARIVRTQFHEIPSPSGVPRIVQNRNVLLWLYPGALGVKTGFTSAAGFCLVGAATRDGVRLVAVVLGEPREPFSDAAALLDYGFTTFHRVRLATEGQSVGSVAIGGRRVPVRAGASRWALAPIDAPVRRRVVAEPGVAFPPAVGERVGVLVVSTPNGTLGRVPVVVGSVPGPPEPAPGPWWWRAGSTVAHAVASLLAAVFG